MTAADWTVAVTRRSTDADGTLRLEATVSDAGVAQADIALALTADRNFSVTVLNRAGTVGIGGIDAAWSNT